MYLHVCMFSDSVNECEFLRPCISFVCQDRHQHVVFTMIYRNPFDRHGPKWSIHLMCALLCVVLQNDSVFISRTSMYYVLCVYVCVCMCVCARARVCVCVYGFLHVFPCPNPWMPADAYQQGMASCKKGLLDV